VSLSGEDGSRTLLVLPKGSGITLLNAEVNYQSHSITADDVVPGTLTPLFDSPLVDPGDSGDVTGVATLAPGLYKFHCRIDFHDMHGFLNVVAIPGGY
jgi:uncharacterized cupredoxin-like copper-binding protein